MEDILFSVVVPVYNAEKYLENCVTSIIEQPIKSIEVFLVDDQSTDSSPAICDKFASQDSRIKVIHKQNEGPDAARNTGIALAKGRYIINVDADDFIAKDCLVAIKEYLEQDDYDGIFFNWDIVDEAGKMIGEKKHILKKEVLTDKREIYLRLFSDNGFNPGVKRVLKREAYQHMQSACPIPWGEDLYRLTEVAKYLDKILLVPDVFYHYTTNLNSLTKMDRSQTYVVNHVVRAKVLSFLREENIFTEQDFKQYQSYCGHLLFDGIRFISRFHCSRNQKITYLNQHRSDPYYKDFLATGKLDNPYEDFIVSLFRKGKDHLLLNILETRENLGKMKRFILKK